MLTAFKWMGVAYVCGVLALVAISILKTLNEPPQPPRAQSDPQPQDTPQTETLYEVAGSVFTRAEVDRLANLRHNPVAIERRRAMTVTQAEEAR